jgi:glutathione synthase/RimK-type ligase-like ATP-grasp enzyme
LGFVAQTTPLSLRTTRVILNWGCSVSHPRIDNSHGVFVINKPECVAIACNKLSFARRASYNASNGLVAPRVPETTESSEKALEWLSEGIVVFARTLLTSHSGRGIVEMESPQDMVPAKLYSKYVKKTHEYRVHIFGDDVIQVDRKARRLDVQDEDVNWRVRNNDNGFTYCRNVQCPQDIQDQAIKAIQMCGLDFGAVDVLWNERQQKAYVCEVNTAPGLEGITLDNYLKEIKERYLCV